MDEREPRRSSPARRGGDAAPERSRPEAARPDQQAPARRGGDAAPERSRPEAARPSVPVQAGKYLGTGMTWALSTALFLYLGTWVDRWVGTESVFALLGAFVGAAAGFYYLYHHLVSEPRERSKGKRGDAPR